jgi:hypothetical protein
MGRSNPACGRRGEINDLDAAAINKLPHLLGDIGGWP